MKNMFKYINNYYGLNCRLHQVILFQNERMIIDGVYGHYLKCWDCNANKYVTLHPNWEVTYTEEFDKLPKISKSKDRYQKYLRSECSETFGEWLKAKMYKD